MITYDKKHNIRGSKSQLHYNFKSNPLWAFKFNLLWIQAEYCCGMIIIPQLFFDLKRTIVNKISMKLNGNRGNS